MQNKKRVSSGFTVIELIVVIAIIAGLAAIVTAATVSYISKAKDAAVKANLSQVSKKMQMYYGEEGNNSFELFPPPEINLPCSLGVYYIHSDANSYAVYALLCSDATNYWCVDSVGRSVQLNEEPLGNECVN